MDDNNDKKSWISATETQDKTNTGTAHATDVFTPDCISVTVLEDFMEMWKTAWIYPFNLELSN